MALQKKGLSSSFLKTRQQASGAWRDCLGTLRGRFFHVWSTGGPGPRRRVRARGKPQPRPTDDRNVYTHIPGTPRQNLAKIGRRVIARGRRRDRRRKLFPGEESQIWRVSVDAAPPWVVSTARIAPRSSRVVFLDQYTILQKRQFSRLKL